MTEKEQSQFEQLSSMVKKLQSNIQSLSNDVIILSTDNTYLKQSNETLTGDVCAMADKIDALNKDKKDLTRANKPLHDQVKKLEKKILKLEKENEKLRNQYNRDSGNSSKPSSSNTYRKIYNSRKKSNKKVGGQKGHKGKTLECRIPDEIIECHDSICSCGCHANRTGNHKVKQVVDIKIKTTTKEIRLYEMYCGDCKCTFYSDNEYSNLAKVSYGDNLTALVSTLRDMGYISLNRLKSIITGITDGAIQMSESTIVNITKRMGKTIEPIIEHLKTKALEANVIHVDETPVRNNGKVEYIHGVSTKDFAVLQAHPKRGDVALTTIDILPQYKNYLVCDHFSMYFKYGKDWGACGAHILRYLESTIQNYKRSWAKEMKSFLIKLNKEKRQLLKKHISEFSGERLSEIENTYESIINKGKAEFIEPTNTFRDYHGEDMKLLRRMEKFKHNILLYAKVFEVPFTNNQIERDLRMFKVKTKVSGCFRGDESLASFANVASLINTLEKKGINPVQALIQIQKEGVEPILASL